MHSFSGNQKRVIFSCTLSTEICLAAKSEDYQANLGRKKVKPFFFLPKEEHTLLFSMSAYEQAFQLAATDADRSCILTAMGMLGYALDDKDGAKAMLFKR